MNNYDIMNINSKFKLILRRIFFDNESNLSKLEQYIYNSANSHSIVFDNIIYTISPDHSLELRIKTSLQSSSYKIGSLDDVQVIIRSIINAAIYNFIMNENDITRYILETSTTYNFTIEETECLSNIFMDETSLNYAINSLNGSIIDYENYILRI